MYAGDVAAAGVLLTSARLCFSDADANTAGIQPALDPAKIAGKIVACDRGTNARTDKGLAVKNGGGVGMILMNTSPNSLNADFHFVPTIHVTEVDRAKVVELHHIRRCRGDGELVRRDSRVGRGARDGGVLVQRAAIAGGGDLLKPDITAPGVDVIAAVSPVGRQRELLRRRVRHIHVEPAHRRHRGAADRQAPGMVADGGQVRDDDNGQPD